MKKPELLAPAGSLEHLRMAVDYGADAVYAGIPRWSLRVRGNGFSREDFAAGIAYAHEHGRKFFAVLNVIPHMRRVNAFDEALHEVAALKPDAFIMADPGLIDRAITLYPEIPVHLSVQANTVNAGTVKFWQKIGVKRCILARELSLSEIAMIREACPDMELEVFIHGALCIAVSGRCLISGLLARRDANLGACNNSCRWNYRTKDLSLIDAQGAHPVGLTGEHIAFAPQEQSALDQRDLPSLYAEIEETSRRQGEWMPLEEDEHGSYLMNSKDLCALPVLKELMELGVDSLKIEGRSRSPFYAGGISRAYRLAIDAIAAGQDIPEESYTIVGSIPARGYTTALLEAHKPNATQDYETNAPSPGKWQVVGQILSQADNGDIYIKVKNKFEANTLFGELNTGRVDVAANCFAITETRLKNYLASIPIYADAQVIIVKPESKYKTFEDLRGQTMGVTAGQAAQTTVENMAPEYDWKVITYEDSPQGFLDCANGRIESYANTVTNIEKAQKAQGLKFRMLEQKLFGNNVGWWYAKNEKGEELRDELNKVLREMHKDGTLSRITTKWFYDDLTKLISDQWLIDENSGVK